MVTMSANSAPLTLRALLGDYPNTLVLKRGEIGSSTISFDFADVRTPSHAFKDVVRHQKFDVAELAIVTYLQAKAYGKPLVLLPAVVVGHLFHPLFAYNAERGRITPADLPGRRVGIRAYSVTTAAWIRGILQNDYGVDLDKIKWVTFEDAHVAEYHDPDTTTRAPGGKQLLAMLLNGELDAAVVGGADLKDSRLQPVIANPSAAAEEWCRRQQATPINHMVVVKESLSKSNPEAVREIFRLLRESKKAAPNAAKEFDPLKFGIEANRRGLELIIDYSV
jgi:4,5-dihydroxyphthalate decarboxylase